MKWTPNISHANNLFGSVTQTSRVTRKLIRDESDLELGIYNIDPESILAKKKHLLLLQGGKTV